MKASKHLGFLALVLGALVIACAAALPVSFTADAGTTPEFTLRGDDCGPAVYAAFHPSASPCRAVAERRLLRFATAGLVLAATGLVLFAGGDARRSRVQAAPARRRRAILRP